jgi:NADH-ubiquinone oxidoreductase chain 5
MYFSLILLPIISSIITGFLGRKIGKKGGQFISTSSIFITMLLSLIIFLEVGGNSISVYFNMFRWVDSEILYILWSFNFDSLTISMLIPVLIVSFLVHLYSIGYMETDPHNQRFFSYLNLFTFMMIILVTSNNLLVMFVGWEGVGVCSYLLVNFWYTRIAANQSSISAFLTNRVGDCFLTIGIFIVILSFGSLNYSIIFSIVTYFNDNIIMLIGICLLIGAMAKSSQLGLHVWLPMAMEGPTPVSALIHAATMVTAGVYLLIRTSNLIEYNSTVLILCLWLGGLTTMTSSLIGFFQQDIKKIIAYSTMSQLGMMVIAIGLSCYNTALFHLINHAFYKALLFLGAGSVIHAIYDNQDLRKYGGLKSYLPLTYSVMLIASLSLIALPFMTGFYSKDLILESAYGKFLLSSMFIYSVAIIAAVFTTLYSIKILYLSFFCNPNGLLIDYNKIHESNFYMSIPLIILSVFSIIFGFFTKEIYIGLGSDFFFDNSIYIHPINEIMIDTENIVPVKVKIFPFFLSIIFFVLYIIIINILKIFDLAFFKFFIKYIIKIYINAISVFNVLVYYVFSFLNQRALFEFYYNQFVSQTILNLGGQTTKFIDKGSVEYLGPYGLEVGLLYLSNKLSKLDTGLITYYALYIMSGFILYIYLISFEISNELLLIILISFLLIL